jgi:hypothetical protein
MEVWDSMNQTSVDKGTSVRMRWTISFSYWLTMPPIPLATPDPSNLIARAHYVMARTACSLLVRAVFRQLIIWKFACLIFSSVYFPLSHLLSLLFVFESSCFSRSPPCLTPIAPYSSFLLLPHPPFSVPFHLLLSLSLCPLLFLFLHL